ncbi:MAG: hypothetical protein H0X31_15525 [Nostocaceae cyanobacterium]|nr:hypothetical protein [Nostocaceae cyanobacterium]
MTTVTSIEIAQFRSQLAEDEGVMAALDVIEDCEGDLEDAAMSLAIRVGQEPGRANAEWLDALCRKWRTVICQPEFRQDLLNGSLQGMLHQLTANRTFPKILAAPVLMYVLKQGANHFCEPLDAMRETSESRIE